MSDLKTVFAYHNETKHAPDQFAKGPGRLDWSNEPDPFRRYRGTSLIPLNLADPRGGPTYDTLYQPESIPAAEPDPAALSNLFQFSFALSAWKQYRDVRWALRVNPSSGNLHPTEAYIVIGHQVSPRLPPGVYHYACREHALEQRCTFPTDTSARMFHGFPDGTFFVGLSSIHWREAWKYGQRAYRYCQHDIGHALAALSFAAATLGWRLHPLTELADKDVAAMLGLDRTGDFQDAEPENPDCLTAVCSAHRPADATRPNRLSSRVKMAVQESRWTGKANRLSAEHINWEWITRVTEACRKPADTQTPPPANTNRAFTGAACREESPAARRIIHQRRSAVAFDAVTAIEADRFFHMMRRLCPTYDSPPWWALGPPTLVDLLLFAHRVEGLAPGLYALLRSPDRLARLRKATREAFEWDTPAECPDSLPLYRLHDGDYRRIAGHVSCNQAIAADGAFAVAMIADFQQSLAQYGPWLYRRLHWEAGMIGQVLYLEAEAAGLRGTGIGCFFDDEVHRLLGLTDAEFQTIYHFTVGGPVEDPRLATLPPYAHLNAREE